MSRKRILQLAAVAVIIGAIIYGAMSSRRGEQNFAWPLATCSSGETVTNCFAQAFADYVDELSGGKMKIQVYTDSTLGTNTELMESLKDGDIPFTISSPSVQVSYMPELCVFDTPCVYENISQFRRNMENEALMNKLRKIYEDHGYRILGFGDEGFREMTMSKPYKDLSSLAGQKIRVMENKYHIQFWKSVKANPTPMAFSEVYIGLQQKAIDAQENSLTLIMTAKLYEQQKRVVLTNVVPDVAALVASGVFMDSLTQEQREIISEAAHKAQEYARTLSDRKVEEALSYLAEQGTEIVTPSEEDYAKMKKLCAPVWDSVRRDCGSELFEAYTQIPE